MKLFRKIFILILIAAPISHKASGLDASCLFSDQRKCPPTIIEYSVKNIVVGNSESRIQDLFGLDSDFHSVQGVLTNESGQFRAEGADLLLASGVKLIRNSGAPNEINWEKCIGNVENRPAQKLVTWTGPIVCRFGYAEYEALLAKIDAKKSWNIANLAGYEFGELPIGLMVKGALSHASFVKRYSPNRKRYWELGNELSDGPRKWTKEKYVERALSVGNGIKSVDPNAQLVVPLLVFKTNLASDYLGHDSELAKSLVSLSPEFSVHTYYENYPEGLSTSEWVTRIEKVDETLRKSGVVAPGIWVSEHSRWPKGNPSQKEWRETWYQTNDYNAVLHVASFLFALSQVDSVNGAMWHALRGGPWNYIFETKDHNLSLSPVAQLFSFLNVDRANLDTLKVVTTKGDENICFTVLRNRITANKLIWGVNKSKKKAEVSIKFEGDQIENILVQGDSIRGMNGEAEEGMLTKQLITPNSQENNTLSISIEPNSIVSLKLITKGKK